MSNDRPSSPAARIARRKSRRMKVLSRIETIAPLPQAVLEIVALTNDPDVGFEDIERAASKDPVLTARFFKLANSAFLQGVEKVTSVSEAVRRLGWKTIRNLAIATGARASMTPSGCASERERLWLHSIACALAAQEVSSRMGQGNAVSANLFLAGLMHDVGRLAFEGLAEGGNEAYLHTTSEEERQICGIEHSEMSVRLMQEWELPADTLAMVEAHHADDFADREAPGAAAVLRLVDPWIHALLEAKEATDEDAPPDDVPLDGLLSPAALAQLELDERRFADLVDGIPARVFAAIEALENDG